MDLIVIAAVARHCTVRDLISLFLTGKTVNMVLSHKETITSLCEQVCSLLPKDRVFLLKTIWNNRQKLTSNNHFPFFITLVDKYYITERTRKHIPDVNKYVERCIEYGRLDLIRKLTEGDLRAITGSVLDTIINIFIDDEDHGALRSLSHNLTRSVHDILIQLSWKGKLNLFKRFYEESMRMHPRVASVDPKSYAMRFIMKYNVEGTRYMLCTGEASLTAFVIECILWCRMTELISEIDIMVTPEDYHREILTYCYGNRYLRASRWLNGDKGGLQVEGSKSNQEEFLFFVD